MKKLNLTLLLLLPALLMADFASAQEARTLDQLLNEVRQQRSRQAAENRTREQEFIQARDQQRTLLNRVRSELSNENARSESLKASFDQNELALAELEDTLRVRVGDMGELFGVVRQVAGDANSLIQSSLVTAQYPDRTGGLLQKLAEAKELPRIAELDNLRILLMEEMVASGKVSRFPTTIVTADGERSDVEAVRVGVFNLITGDRFLTYNTETGAIEELARQPADRFRSSANDLFNAPAGTVQAMAIDPTYGGLLSLLIQAPNFIERIKQGREVGYVIIALGLFGLLLAAERMLYLTVVGAKIRSQLKSDTPNKNNALGRILSVYTENKDFDTETLELKLDEAILKETPPLEKRQGTIKVLAAVAPLLGLLGTVTGMIATFQSITLFGTGDPKLMAGGISQALVTTVLGLVAAIPLVLLHSLISGRSRNLIEILEEQSAGIIAQQSEKLQ